jgi:hypothetical protein
MTTAYVQKQSTIAKNTRPFCNFDYTNTTPYKHGLPRPLRIYRKSTIKPRNHYTNGRSSQSMIQQTMDTPGQSTTSTIESNLINAFPIHQMVYQNNMKNTTVANSLRLVRTKGFMNKEYSSNYHQYLEKRCKTFEQQSFNFPDFNNNNTNVFDKPGSPITLNNTYTPNCSECINNPECNKKVVYKPSNYQFATQGSVSSDLRTLKLGLNTIETNIYLKSFCK